MPYYHMMDWMGGDWFPFMGLGSIFVWIVFLAIAYIVYKDAESRGLNGLLWGLPILIPWLGIVFLILYLIMREDKRFVSSAGKTQVEARTEKGPGDILDERYARGELTREQFMQMKEDIRKPGI
jgi:putative membrane protein